MTGFGSESVLSRIFITGWIRIACLICSLAELYLLMFVLLLVELVLHFSIILLPMLAIVLSTFDRPRSLNELIRA